MFTFNDDSFASSDLVSFLVMFIVYVFFVPASDVTTTLIVFSPNDKFFVPVPDIVAYWSSFVALTVTFDDVVSNVYVVVFLLKFISCPDTDRFDRLLFDDFILISCDAV